MRGESVKLKINRLNLGCGKRIRKGFVNLDCVNIKGVDIVYNLEETDKKRLPFSDNQFDYILADNVMEHIENFLPLMKEIHRVAKRNSIIDIIVPHFRSFGAFSDPTHKRFFTTFAFDYFEPDNPNNYYIGTRFEVISKKLSFGFLDAKILRARIFNLIIKPLEFFTNINPEIYDKLFSQYIPPLSIYFRIKVLK